MISSFAIFTDDPPDVGCQHHVIMLTFLHKIRKSLIESGVPSRQGPSEGVPSRQGPSEGVPSRQGPSEGVPSRQGPSGSTRKYLLYAIGEIALVVIGIPACSAVPRGQAG